MFFTALLVFVASTAFGPIPAFLSERFPTAVRNSASGFVYNGGLIIGSWSPLIAIHRSGSGYKGRQSSIFLTTQGERTSKIFGG